MTAIKKQIGTAGPWMIALAVILILSPFQTIQAWGAGWKQVGSDIEGEAAGDWSGYSVSLSADGNVVALGAINAGSDSAGQVRVYQNNAGTWTQIGGNIDGEAVGHEFGYSVSLSADGSVVAIGAVYAGSDSAGQVRVYQNNAGTWTQVGSAIDGEAGDNYYGGSVSLSADGNVVAIGTHDNSDLGLFGLGHVRVYRNNAGIWTQVGSNIDGEAEEDRSDYSVALSADGNVVAIGEYRNTDAGGGAGQVRVFRNNAGTWTQVGSDINGAAAGDYCGWSVALSSDGSVVASGEYVNDDAGGGAGQIRVFRNNAGTWTQVGSDIHGAAAGDWCGWSVALSSDGSVVASGEYVNSDAGGHAGQVRVFRNDAGAWTQVGSDIQGAAAGDWCGWSVALSSDGSVVASGEYENDDAGSIAGQARVFGYDLADDLEINTQHGSVGNDVTYTISVNKAPNLVDAFGMDIAFDSTRLSYQGFARGALTTGFFAVEANIVSPGVLRIGGYTIDNKIPIGASGALVTITFKNDECLGSQLIIQDKVDDIATWSTKEGLNTCDDDVDGDGIPNVTDNCPDTYNDTQTDTDSDGTGDVCDDCPADSDKTEPGTCGCGVADTDTDSDGAPDCNDNCPADPDKTEPGTCGCGVSDTDTDSDGAPDCNDNCPADPDKTEPGACGCGVADTDTDSDGTPDCNDGCPNDINKIAAGACGCGVADTDTDSDGTPDCNDNCPADPDKTEPGACGCGVADTDTDSDGTPDCNDNCPDDPDKTNPGACGCGTPDTDSDGDGRLDCHDKCSAGPNHDDFNGDGKSDILWRNTSTGLTDFWFIDGVAKIGYAALGTVATDWNIEGKGDFDADGQPDILWRNTSTGDIVISLQDGPATAASATIFTNVSPDWQIFGVGDFDGDGMSDILWRYMNFADPAKAGRAYIMLMDVFDVKSAKFMGGKVSSDWEIQGTGDFDGDGMSDILWRNMNFADAAYGGKVCIWQINGVALKGSGIFGGKVASTWEIQGAGDFDGDGMSDILWRYTDAGAPAETGKMLIWFMNGLTISKSSYVRDSGNVVLQPPLIWGIAALGDYDNDCLSDILFRRTDTGGVLIYLMNGNILKRYGVVGTRAVSDWIIAK